jgi:hypothetical protein
MPPAIPPPDPPEVFSFRFQQTAQEIRVLRTSPTNPPSFIPQERHDTEHDHTTETFIAALFPSRLLLETGGFLLLENGDWLLLESEPYDARIQKAKRA